MVYLSHSAISLYKTCPKRYEYNYIYRYRSKTMSSALFFGTYFGDTVQMYALNKKDVLTEEESAIAGKDPYTFFNNLMESVDINGTVHSLRTCPLIRYYKSDYDETLLTEEDILEIDTFREENGFYLDGNPLTFEDFIGAYLAGNLDDDEFSFMNLHFWLSLKRKGKLMIDAYINEVYPRIVKVHAIEKKIVLESGENDALTGYIDMVADYRLDAENAERIGMREDDVVTVIFDHKTGSAKYPKNKIQTDSQQLSIYEFAEQIGTCGYIVAVKKMKTPKRGPRVGETYCDIQVLIDRIPEEVIDEYIESAGSVLDKVYDKEFPKDTSGCKTFGKQCEYYGICQDGKDDSYLFQKEKRK